MRFVDEYRDPAAARRWSRASPSWPATTTSSSWRCAAATPTPSTATASSTCCRRTSSSCTGPGCPVCVIPMGRVDDAIAVAETPGVIFTSFGDMMRVPGSNGNLLEAKARGADVRFVYSPLDALRIADRDARPRRGVLRGRLRDDRAVDRADAAAGPRARHRRTSACSATTSRSSRRSRRSSSRPICASTASSAPATCRRSSASGPTASCPRSTASRWSPPASSRSTSSRRSRCCSPRSGRVAARSRTSTPAWSATRATRGPSRFSAEVFELRPHFEWRGLGFISQSALKLRPEFAAWDAELRYRGARRPGRRPEGVPVRRGAQGRDQAVGVQGLRDRLHARDPDRHVHGLVRRGVRGVLQLRPAAPRGLRDASGRTREQRADRPRQRYPAATRR